MNDDSRQDELSVGEVLGWAEFCAWTTLVMAPIIYWQQGPSVSYDQQVARTGLVVLAVLAAIGLRIRAILEKRRNRRKPLS